MSKKNLMMRLLIVCLTVFVLGGTLLSVLRFRAILKADEYKAQEENLLNLAKLEASVIETKLEDYINTLMTIEELLRDDRFDVANYMEYLHALTETDGFYQMGVITPDGILHDTHGEVDVSDRTYYEAVLQGEAYVTGIIASRITGEKVITLAVPAYDNAGQVLGAIHGTILLEQFEPYSDTALAVGNVNTYIFDRRGNYIIKNNQEGASRNYDNIFDHLEQAEGGMSIDALYAAIQDGQSVTTEVLSGDKAYLCCFLPIRNGEWYALVDIPTGEIDDYVSGMMDRDFYRMITTIVLLEGVLCAGVLFWNRRRSIWEREREIELRNRLMAQVVGFMVVDLDEEHILSRSGRGLLRADQEQQSYPDYIAGIAEKGIHPEHKKAFLQYFSMETIRAEAAAGFRKRSAEFLFRYRDEGDSVWLECESHLEYAKDSGHLIVSHILRDINSRKQRELVLRNEAETDMLTGLYNRNTGVRLIDGILAFSKPKDTHTLILLDLDNFKTLNDTFGHQYGDQALKDVASIISTHFRKEDIVCRLGGDEFIVFLKSAPVELVRKKVQDLLNKLQLQYEKNGQTVWIGASAGLVFTSSGKSFEDLYQCVDQALYQAKREGKATFREYA